MGRELWWGSDDEEGGKMGREGRWARSYDGEAIMGREGRWGRSYDGEAMMGREGRWARSYDGESIMGREGRWGRSYDGEGGKMGTELWWGSDDGEGGEMGRERWWDPFFTWSLTSITLQIIFFHSWTWNCVTMLSIISFIVIIVTLTSTDAYHVGKYPVSYLPGYYQELPVNPVVTYPGYQSRGMYREQLLACSPWVWRRWS